MEKIKSSIYSVVRTGRYCWCGHELKKGRKLRLMLRKPVRETAQRENIRKDLMIPSLKLEEDSQM